MDDADGAGLSIKAEFLELLDVQVSKRTATCGYSQKADRREIKLGAIYLFGSVVNRLFIL